MNEQPVEAELEIWTRSKCGLRVRSRTKISLDALLSLENADIGCAITNIVRKSLEDIQAEVTEMDRRWEAARRAGSSSGGR